MSLVKVALYILLAIKWCVIAIGMITIIAVIMIMAYDNIYWPQVHCIEKGWARDDALEHALNQLREYTKDNPHLGKFEILEDKTNKDGNSWSFSFRSKDCSLTINVDKCGTTDIIDHSFGCSTFKNKLRWLEGSSKESLEETLRRLEVDKYSDKAWIELFKKRIDELSTQAALINTNENLSNKVSP